MGELTHRQKEILQFIMRVSEERGYPPTIREIGEEMGIRSTNGVNDHLKALERKGFLTRSSKQSRSLVPTKRTRLLLGAGKGVGSAMVDVPLLGRVAAGAPMFAQQDAEESVCIDNFLLGGVRREVFALRVKGHSMVDDNIHDGDLIFVQKVHTVSPGDIVVALIEDEATVKRFYPEGDRVRFQPANKDMQPLYVAKSEFLQTMILGKIIGLYRNIPRAASR